MSANSRIGELVRADLLDDHEVDGVHFIEELLLVAAEVGEVQCSLAGDRALRFQTPSQPAWVVELGRAKSKLRMLCARLSVLCNEGDGPAVSLYGGAGVIKKAVPAGRERVRVLAAPASPTHAEAVPGNSSTGPGQWAVQFVNTPSQQEFTIQAQ